MDELAKDLSTLHSIVVDEAKPMFHFSVGPDGLSLVAGPELLVLIVFVAAVVFLGRVVWKFTVGVE